MTSEENIRNYLEKIGLEQQLEFIVKQLKKVNSDFTPLENWRSIQVIIEKEGEFIFTVYPERGLVMTVYIKNCERLNNDLFCIGDFIVLNEDVFFSKMNENEKERYKHKEKHPFKISGINYDGFLEDKDPEGSPVYYELKEPILDGYWYSDEHFRLATKKESEKGKFLELFSTN